MGVVVGAFDASAIVYGGVLAGSNALYFGVAAEVVDATVDGVVDL